LYPVIFESGKLPRGVSFKDTRSGLVSDTATLTGTPAPGTAGTYRLTITAISPGAVVTQKFTLIVKK
jgi:hypothetical protein